jgi:nucleotide-binding universal stress UspA family protein
VKAFERILVPVDFNPAASAALDCAAMMALPFHATVEIMHVWQPPTLIPANFVLVESAPGAVPKSLEDVARDQAVKQAHQLAEQLQSRGVAVHVTIGIGKPAHEILAFAESGRFDLVVMGTQGHTGVARALLGSVAERVVRHAPCPVMVVHADSRAND